MEPYQTWRGGTTSIMRVSDRQGLFYQSRLGEVYARLRFISASPPRARRDSVGGMPRRGSCDNRIVYFFRRRSSATALRNNRLAEAGSGTSETRNPRSRPSIVGWTWARLLEHEFAHHLEGLSGLIRQDDAFACGQPVRDGVARGAVVSLRRSRPGDRSAGLHPILTHASALGRSARRPAAERKAISYCVKEKPATLATFPVEADGWRFDDERQVWVGPAHAKLN